MQAIATEEDVLGVPDLEQEAKADGEGEGAVHFLPEFGKCLGNFEGNNQQGDREGEDRVAEGLDAADFVTSPRNAVVSAGRFGHRKQSTNSNTITDRTVAGRTRKERAC